MKTRTTLALTALAATLTMLFAVTSASANRLSVDDTAFRVTWASLEFTSSVGVTTRCPVTLVGDFHSSTIVKTRGLLIGFVDSATVNNAACVGGRATVLAATLPWHVTYEGFTGTLPNITSVSILLVNASFQVQQTILGIAVTCLARTTVAENATGTISLSAGVATELRARGTIDTNDIGAGTTCDNLAVDGTFAGTARVTDGGGNSVTVRLI